MSRPRPDFPVALALLAAAAAGSAHGPRGGKPPPKPQAVPGYAFLVLNNSASTLHCAASRSGAFDIPAGGQWSRNRASGETWIRFRCARPIADGVVSILFPGNRYSLLKGSDGIVHLNKVVA